MTHPETLRLALRRFPYLINLARRAVWAGDVVPFRKHLDERLDAIRAEYRNLLKEMNR